MTATIPEDAIDPEAGYREWRAQYLWHCDQLPAVVEVTGTVAMGPRMVRAQQLRERVSGGGFVDNMPVVDGPESRMAGAVWHALRAYLAVASSRLGVEAPTLPPALPDDLDTARRWAFVANEWMAAWVDHILDWPDLATAEGELFRLIRRARARLGVHTAHRGPGEDCPVCGEPGVVVDWVDGPDGAAVLSKTCRVCEAVLA